MRDIGMQQDLLSDIGLPDGRENSAPGFHVPHDHDAKVAGTSSPGPGKLSVAAAAPLGYLNAHARP